jgi:hypothetical protein
VFLAATLPGFCVGCLLDFGWPVAFLFWWPWFSAVSFFLVAFSADDLDVL